MSIELTSSPAPSKAPSSGESGQVKGKSNSAADASVADAGGFLSLLMSLGGDATSASLPSPAGAAEGDALLKEGKEAKVDLSLATDPAMDPALLLAQSLQLMQAMPRVESVQAVKPDAAQMQSLQTLSRKGAVSPQAPALTADVSAEMGGEAGKAMQLSSKLASSRREALDAAAQAGAGSQAQESGQSSDQRFAKSLQLETKVEASVPLAAAVATTAGAAESSGFKTLERQADKFGVKQVGGGEGAWGHQALLTGARVDSASATTGTAMPSPETMVAEQVKYWISSNVQNAELTLDGFGKSPVEVSISLNGTDARVEFRTDQPEVRQILEGSATHLKDLLQSEGMVLSGVSVGSSGQDGQAGSQDQERRSRPHNIKQATVLAPEPLAATRAAGATQLSGRAVDLFV